MKETLNDRHIKSFARRTGHFSELQQRGFDLYAKPLLLPYSKEKLDWAKIFGNTNPVALEIGFGMGQTSYDMALANPDYNFVGVEVHTPGVGALLERLGSKGINNFRIINHDAVDVLQNMIVEESFARLHVFFPDPWPKLKHRKRRLIQAEFLDTVARYCKPGCFLHLATDWQHYAESMLKEIARSENWQLCEQNAAERPMIRTSSAFERKGLAKNHKIWDIYVCKSRLDDI